MYIFCIVLILIASVLIILAVLAQSPKSGMAANFGASNQVMGVRQTADFLEKFTWGLAIAIVILSLLATMTMPSANISSSKSGVEEAGAGYRKQSESAALVSPVRRAGSEPCTRRLCKIIRANLRKKSMQTRASCRHAFLSPCFERRRYFSEPHRRIRKLCL